MRTNSMIILLFLLFINFPSSSSAQNTFNNSLDLSLCNFGYPHLMPLQFGLEERIADEFAAYYKRKIYKHWNATVGFAEWNTFFDKKDILNTPSVLGSIQPTDLKVGYLQWRTKYKMIDLFISHEYTLSKRHVFSAGAGPSYCWGQNTYIDTFYISPFPPPDDDVEIISKTKTANYWGAIGVLSYDYLCIYNRMRIGADIRCRKYFGLNYEEIDYGIHLGVNF